LLVRVIGCLLILVIIVLCAAQVGLRVYRGRFVLVEAYYVSVFRLSSPPNSLLV